MIPPCIGSKPLSKTLVLCALVAAAFSTSTLLAAGTELFVSPTGSDTNPGTQAMPVQTVHHARDLVRKMAPTMTGDITVWLAGGTYRLSEPLILDAKDSGTGGHNVIYAAMPDQTPIISGGLPVTGWKLVDAKKNLWSAPAPAGLTNTRQIYINGVRAERTKGLIPAELTQTMTGYTASTPVMVGWRNQEDLEFVYTGGLHFFSQDSRGLGGWTQPRCPVAKIEGTTITMAQPCWDNSTQGLATKTLGGSKSKGSAPPHGSNPCGSINYEGPPEYVENAYELLGTPGQFYFDRKERVIYYVPRPGENLATANVEVPVLEKLLTGDGSEAAPIHNIIFKGLEFSYAAWLFPSSTEGFREIQANLMFTGPDGAKKEGFADLVKDGTTPFGNWTKASGNVSFSYDHQIQFLNDAFVHLGGVGLDLGNGSQEDTVQGCVFTDISANGLQLGGVDLPEGNSDQVTRDNKILNNHIYNVACEFHGGIGIWVGYAQNTLIAHNQIDHLPYTAISIGWGGWLDKIERAGVANNSHDNQIKNNLIFNFMQLLADGGCLYTQGLTGSSLETGEKLIGNVMYNDGGYEKGIYTDNGCNNVTAKNNVIFHLDHFNWGVRHRNYYDGNDGSTWDYFDFEDNYWQQGDPDGSIKNVTLKNNHIIGKLDEAPAEILQNAGLEPKFKDILKKSFCVPSAPEPPKRAGAFVGNGFALVAWNPSVFDGGAPVLSYTATSSTGEKATISAADFAKQGYVKIPNLSKADSYSFSVTASNANGISSPSLPSASVSLDSQPIQPPEAPDSVEAVAGNGRATIIFKNAKGEKGKGKNDPLLAIEVTVNPGGRKASFSGPSLLGGHFSFVVVEGLENGKTYTFDVAWVNPAGAGPAKSSEPLTIDAKR
jgi:hypothetical protein